MDGGNAGFAGAKTGPEPQCKKRGLLTILSGPRSSWLLASLALRASLRLLLPLVVASFTKANDAYAAIGGRLQASCLSPCGPAFGCSILFQQNCPCPYPLVWNHPNDAIGFAKRRASPNGPGKNRSNLNVISQPSAGRVFGFRFLCA